MRRRRPLHLYGLRRYRVRAPEGEGPLEVSSVEGNSDRMAEAVRLAIALGDRVLNAQLIGQAIPPQQIEALVKAARFFQDCGEPWPPMLTQALHEVAATMRDATSEADAPSAEAASQRDEPADPNPPSDERGVMRYFSALMKKKD
jgi:hypothetical protein